MSADGEHVRRAALLVEMDLDIARGHAARCAQWSADATEEANELAGHDDARAAGCRDVAALWTREAETWREVAKGHERRLQALRRGDTSAQDPTGRPPSLLHYAPGAPIIGETVCRRATSLVAHTTDPWEVSIADDPCPTCLPVAQADLATREPEHLVRPNAEATACGAARVSPVGPHGETGIAWPYDADKRVRYTTHREAVTCRSCLTATEPPDVYSATRGPVTPAQAEAGREQAAIIERLGSEP